MNYCSVEHCIPRQFFGHIQNVHVRILVCRVADNNLSTHADTYRPHCSCVVGLRTGKLNFLEVVKQMETDACYVPLTFLF